MTNPILPIAKLFQACEPNESLPPDDKRYVNFDTARGDSPAPSYARSLRRSDPTRPEIKLLAGHRGIGKTSELLRLKKIIGRTCFVISPLSAVQSDFLWRQRFTGGQRP